MNASEPITNLRPTAVPNLFAPDDSAATGPGSLAQAVPAAHEDTLAPAPQPRDPGRVMVKNRKQLRECRAADLVFTRLARAEERMEAVAFGVLTLGAVIAIAASFSASLGLIRQWQSFLALVESVLK